MDHIYVNHNKKVTDNIRRGYKIVPGMYDDDRLQDVGLYDIIPKRYIDLEEMDIDDMSV